MASKQACLIIINVCWQELLLIYGDSGMPLIVCNSIFKRKNLSQLKSMHI